MLNDGEFVFCSFNDTESIDIKQAVCVLKEPEGVSVIFPKGIADERKYSYSYIASWITLMVNSSLEAVGLTAAVSAALAEENISANVVAGFYHDHVFVAEKDADRAMRVLAGLGRSKK